MFASGVRFIEDIESLLSGLCLGNKVLSERQLLAVSSHKKSQLKAGFFIFTKSKLFT